LVEFFSFRVFGPLACSDSELVLKVFVRTPWAGDGPSWSTYDLHVRLVLNAVFWIYVTLGERDHKQRRDRDRWTI